MFVFCGGGNRVGAGIARPKKLAPPRIFTGAYRMCPYVRCKIFRIPQGRIPYPPVQSGGYAKRPPLRGGSREAGGGESRVYIRSFGLRQGSLPLPLRGTAPPLAQAPPPPYRGESPSQREASRHVLNQILSIIRVTILVAVFTYSPMLNCLTTSTS